MINLILYGVLGIVGIKMLRGSPSATTTTGVRNVRSVTPIGGHSGTISVNLGTAGGQQSGPTSGAGRPAGNAGQPWYTGAAIAGAGIGATAIAKGLGNLFSRATSPTPDPTEDGPDMSDEDLAASEDEMAASSDSSTEDDEYPDDFLSDESED